MKVDCLLDANSIIKYYVNLPGSEVIKYLFDKSPSTQINITNIQIVEVLSIFYKLRREEVLSSDQELLQFNDTFLNDIKTGKMIVYDFADQHIIDFDVYETITKIPPPFKKQRRVYIPQYGGFVSELKDIANTVDAIMLIIMREMHLITQGECYLFSSDGHVKNVAQDLGLNVLDPEKIAVSALPACLDRRNPIRKEINLKALCVDCDSSLQLPTTNTTDICDHGICLLAKSALEIGKKLSIKLSSRDGSRRLESVEGKVVWINANRAGIQFLNPIQSEVLFS